MGLSVVRTPERGQFILASDSRDASVAVALGAPPSAFYDLFLLNIVLQLFDGMATYSGVHMGVPEGNQLLCNAFVAWGVGPTLLLFKGFACGMLLLLYRNSGEEIGRPAFTLVAAVYCLFSLVPWLIKLTLLSLPLG